MAQRVTAAVVFLCIVAGFFGAPRLAHGYLGDAGSHPPPTNGPHAYFPTAGTFGPGQAGFPAVGGTFDDPVFGSTIRRLTNELPQYSFSENYAKNGFTNADNTLMYHRAQSGRTIINTTSGQVVRSNVPGNFDSSFAPDDPDVWYWFNWGDTRLNRYNVSTGASTVMKTFSEGLGQLGGSVDFIDASGRYMVLLLGSSLRVYDVKADVLYAGSIPASYAASGGWAGMSPDGNYVVTATDPPKFHSFKIDHGARTVSTSPVLFWTLCGDHADLVSASNGKTYLVAFECHSEAAIYAVDVTKPQSASDPAKQRAENTRIIKLASWTDTAGHFSGVSKGAMRDWFFFDIESGDDTFSSPGAWRPYKQEIVMANVLTGEVRRLAHHRSRSPLANYFYTPRVSASWDGTLVSWVSNFGYSAEGYADLYSIRNPGGASASPAPSTPEPPSSPTPSSPAPSTPPGGSTLTKIGGDWYLDGAHISTDLANGIISNAAFAAAYGVAWPVSGAPAAPAPLPPPPPTVAPSTPAPATVTGKSTLQNVGGDWYLDGAHISTDLANGIMTNPAFAAAYGVAWPVSGAPAASIPSTPVPSPAPSAAPSVSSGGSTLKKVGGDWFLNGAHISSGLAEGIVADPAFAAAYGVAWPVSTASGAVAAAPAPTTTAASAASGGLVKKNGDWFLQGTSISNDLAISIMNDPATAAAYGLSWPVAISGN